MDGKPIVIRKPADGIALGIGHVTEDRQRLGLALGDAVPQGFEQYQRLIELVGTAEDDRAHARQRWRHYAGRGLAIQRHDLAAKE